MQAKWYGNGLLAVFKGQVAWLSDSIKLALTTSAYVPNQDTHATFSQITNEASGSGYSAGGVLLASKTATYDPASKQVRLDAADVSITGSFTARVAVIYKDTGVASTSPLLGYVVFDGDEVTSGTTLQFTWDASGVLEGVVL